MATPKFENLSHADMDSLYAEVVRQMAVNGMVPDTVIALSRGGLDFGVKVSNYFDDIPLHPLVWQTRDGNKQSVAELHNILQSYVGRNVLIVDDILDSGETLAGIQRVTEIYDTDMDIYYGVAIENTEADVEVDYSGKQIQRSEHTQWFVFPWEKWWKTK